MSHPLHAHLILTSPSRVQEGLERVRRAEIVEEVPNLFQIELGVVRMWLRVLFRSETVGTSSHPPRPSLRARLLERRPFRFPFLLREQAIAPLDHSGLASTPERVMKHLLAAHHDKNQFSYDLEMLALEPEAISALLERAREVVVSDDARARWLKDLTVYEGYHESLLEAVTRASEGDFGLPDPDANDPDVSFRAYMRWCARQPRDPRELVEALLLGTLDLGAYRPVPREDEASLESLRAKSKQERFALLRAGEPPELDALAGFRYRAFVLSAPGTKGRAWTQAFTRGFARDEARGLVQGFDLPSEDDAKRGARPACFELRGLVRGEPSSLAPHAFVCDYGRGSSSNAPLVRTRRELLVSLSPGSSERLLAWTYYDLAGRVVGSGGRFTLLEREARLARVPTPSRGRRLFG